MRNWEGIGSRAEGERQGEGMRVMGRESHVFSESRGDTQYMVWPTRSTDVKKLCPTRKKNGDSGFFLFFPPTWKKNNDIFIKKVDKS